MTENGIVVRGLSPVLVVEDIGPSLGFWVAGLGFVLVATVPEQAPFDFVMLQRDGVTVMLQTAASVAADTPAMLPAGERTIVYLTVAALDPALRAVAGAEVVVARRRTFYGADEIFLREPGGHVVGLAAFPERDGG